MAIVVKLLALVCCCLFKTVPSPVVDISVSLRMAMIEKATDKLLDPGLIAHITARRVLHPKIQITLYLSNLPYSPYLSLRSITHQKAQNLSIISYIHRVPTSSSHLSSLSLRLSSETIVRTLLRLFSIYTVFHNLTQVSMLALRTE